MKEYGEIYKVIFKALFKAPTVVIICVILLVLTIWAEKEYSSNVVTMLLILGYVPCLGVFASILAIEKDGKKYLRRIGFYTMLWFGSCLALVDFSNFNKVNVLQLLTSMLFIFLGCFVPDFVSKYAPEKMKQEKEFEGMKEKICLLEKRINELEKIGK